MLQLACYKTLLKEIMNSIRFSEIPKYYGIEVQRYDIHSAYKNNEAKMIITLNKNRMN